MTSLTIGRSRDCDILLDENFVSRSHCRLNIEPIDIDSGDRAHYRLTLIDFGSTAGTIVNDKSVDRANLRHDDRFQIGMFRFRFQVLNQDPA